MIGAATAGHKLARAKALLRRDETIRALEAMVEGLQLFEPKKMMGKARFEVEVLIEECVAELNRQPCIRALFEDLAKSRKAFVPYAPGREQKLLETVRLIGKALQDNIAAKEQAREEEKTGRRTTLEQKGVAYLKEGDMPRGKAALRVLAEEFGEEPGVLVQVGELLLEHKLYYEAAEALERSIEVFPKNSKAYSLAADCYKDVMEHDKAEAVYLRAIREFGKHPRTMLNLAKVYLAWNKKEEAFQAAQEALSRDPSLEEAKELVNTLG